MKKYLPYEQMAHSDLIIRRSYSKPTFRLLDSKGVTHFRPWSIDGFSLEYSGI